MSYSELTLEELKVGDPLRADVEEIRRAGARAADLTRQLLAFSRQQISQPRVVELSAVVLDMEKMLQRLLGEDVELTLVAPPPFAKVLADPGQLEQIVMNLVVNARDAMRKGGRLTLEVASVDVDAGYAAAHPNVAPGHYGMLAVSDTGTGMSSATLERMFEPFFTTKEKGKGTGLGLSTVFGIVEQRGGHIDVQSTLGLGTTFKIYLPSTSRPVEASPVDVPAGSVLRGSETILLVEDDEQLRRVNCQILRRHGYAVLDAMNGGEALLLSEKAAGQIDLLLTDVVMPHMSGRELAERLSPLRPEMKVLYVSGYTDDAMLRHNVPEFGLHFLLKPTTPDMLLRRVRDVLSAP